MNAGLVAPAGTLGLHLVRGGVAHPVPRAWPHRPALLADVLEHGAPQRGLPSEVNAWRLRNLPHLWRGWRRVALARSLRLPHFYGQLWLTLIRADGEPVELGLASMRVVTTAGVNFLVDAMQGIVEPEILKFHGIGTTNTAEAAGDTALAAEVTTGLNPDSTRATGSLGEGASANIFRTVGTNTVDATLAIVEHGLFSQAATGGGTLFDRSIFAAVNLVSADQIQTTYDLTLTAGS